MPEQIICRCGRNAHFEGYRVVLPWPAWSGVCPDLDVREPLPPVLGGHLHWAGSDGVTCGECGVNIASTLESPFIQGPAVHTASWSRRDGRLVVVCACGWSRGLGSSHPGLAEDRPVLQQLAEALTDHLTIGPEYERRSRHAEEGWLHLPSTVVVLDPIRHRAYEAALIDRAAQLGSVLAGYR